jgi:AcrR family transcriptional regulator
MTTQPTGGPAARLSPGEIIGRLVDAATRLLAEKGPGEIKARSVAEAAGVSTTAVYYHVGGMPELLEAVADSGFRELALAFDAVATDGDPVTQLFAMALATREVAQRNPHLYDLMFGLSSRGSYRPPGPRSTGGTGRSEAFQAVYEQLVRACERLLDSGRVDTDESPEGVASQLWSCVHGFVSLEIGGQFSVFPDPVRQVLLATTVNIFVALGDRRERAFQSEEILLNKRTGGPREVSRRRDRRPAVRPR